MALQRLSAPLSTAGSVVGSKAIVNSRPIAAIAAATLCIVTLVLTIPWEYFFPREINLSSILEGPSWAHPLGTDALGRDFIASIRLALVESVLPIWLATGLASLAGIAVSTILIVWREFATGARTVTRALHILAVLVASIPITLWVLGWSVAAESNGLIPVLEALAMVFFAKNLLFTQMLYNETAKLGFWTAHAALGGSLLGRIWSYGLRRSWAPSLMDMLCLNLQLGLVVEATVSFLGFGVAEPQPSLGNMLAAHFDLLLKGESWVFFVVLTPLVLCLILPFLLRTLLAHGLASAIGLKKRRNLPIGTWGKAR